MNKGHTKFAIGLLLSLTFVSCKYMSKNKVDLKVDVALLSKPEFCKENKLPDNIVSLFKPSELSGEKIAIVEGNIYQFAFIPFSTLNITGSNSNWINNTKKSLFGDKETIAQVQLEYQNYISSLNIDSLCIIENSNPSNSNSLGSLNEFIKTNHYSNVYVLSDKLEDSLWNNIRVFKDITTLKKTIIESYETSAQSNDLVIINPTVQVENQPQIDSFSNPIDTTGIVSGLAKPDRGFAFHDNIILRKTLLNISNTSLSFDQRLSKVNEAMKNIFSKDLIVETYINSAGVASHSWDKGHGKDYLESLAIEKSIIDFKILAHKGSIPNVTYLQVIEIHKQ